MNDRVRIVHPARPDVVVEVSRRAYERRSRKLGWQLADAPPTPTEPVQDEKAALQTRAAELGVDVDRRWGEKRLRKEIDAAEAAE